MISVRIFIKRSLSFSFIFILMLLSLSFKLSAEEIKWVEVSKTNNEIQFIDINSIKYNNKGLLSVLTKYYKFNLEDQKIVASNSYLIAVDCENRLFSRLPVNGDLSQVKKWEIPNNDKLIKNTIINSCSY